MIPQLQLHVDQQFFRTGGETFFTDRFQQCHYVVVRTFHDGFKRADFEVQAGCAYRFNGDVDDFIRMFILAPGKDLYCSVDCFHSANLTGNHGFTRENFFGTVSHVLGDKYRYFAGEFIQVEGGGLEMGVNFTEIFL